jgi:hypothetical protein
MNIDGPSVVPADPRIVEVERLGDEIAELAAHLDAATGRLLDLIREFDVRGGWGNGFRSCAHWLAWRVGLELGAAREHVRVARALGALRRLNTALACGELSYSKARALACGDARDRRAIARGCESRHRRARRGHRPRLATNGPQGRS